MATPMTSPAPLCLSSNGQTLLQSDQPALRLHVATVGGMFSFQRDAVGAPWRRSGHSLPGRHVSALLHEPRSGLLFAALHYRGGVRVSADDGRSWEPVNDGLASEHAYTLAVQHDGDNTALYAGTEPPMLYRSTDLGRHWQALDAMWNVPDTDQWRFPPPPHLAHVKNVAWHPGDLLTLYVCVEQGDLLRTRDGGKSFHSITSYEKPGHQFRRDMHRTSILPSNPDVLYLCTGVGLFRSRDAGTSWSQLTDNTFITGYPDPFFIDPRDECVLVMAGASAAPNPTWSGTGSARPAIVRSSDGGDSWQQLMGGLPDPVPGNIEAMAFNAAGSRTTLVVGTTVGSVFASDDAGASWQVLAEGLPPISKGAHYRHFVSADERASIEAALKEAIA